MRFLIESDKPLTIYKFNINDDLIKADKDKVWFYGAYKNDPQLRVSPLASKKYTIFKSQIAQNNQFIYIPSDQIKYTDDYLYKWPRAIASKTIDKLSWKTMKNNYPYEGV